MLDGSIVPLDQGRTVLSHLLKALRIEDIAVAGVTGVNVTDGSHGLCVHSRYLLNGQPKRS